MLEREFELEDDGHTGPFKLSRVQYGFLQVIRGFSNTRVAKCVSRLTGGMMGGLVRWLGKRHEGGQSTVN